MTFNTLIDVHGKMGRWEQAVKVVGMMKQEVGCSCGCECTSPCW